MNKVIKTLVSDMTYRLVIIASLIGLSFPAHAATPPVCNLRTSGFKEVTVCFLQTIVDPLLALIAALAGLSFMWGLVRYISKANNKSEREKAKKYIAAGILGLVIMISFIGIARVLTVFLGSTGTNAPTGPPYPSR